MYGVYQHCSSHHLHRNHRQKLGFDDAMRTEELLKGIGGKRLTYRRTDTEA
jgi:hypothetical protein